MQEEKEIIINELDLLEGNQNLIKILLAGMRRRMQVCLHRNEGHIQLPSTR